MTKQATNHLNNVCIMQKYNDSEKVLELREEFKESKAFIKKAVNCHDELSGLLKQYIKHLDSAETNLEMKQWLDQFWIPNVRQALSKAESEPIK